MQYIALIHNNADSSPAAQEWTDFIEAAQATGMFKGGSEIGSRTVVGKAIGSDVTEVIGGFMRFDSDDLESLADLLKSHPVVRHGGAIELCEMPRS